MIEPMPTSDSTSENLVIPRWRRYVGFGILLVGAAGLARFVMLETSKPKFYEVIGAPTPTVDEFRVSDLGRRWQRDANLLLSQLQNRRIMVLGSVVDYYQNRSDQYLRAGLLISSDSADSLPMFCHFDTSEPWFLAQPGQSVSIRGCFGCKGRFELSQCEIISVSGPTCPEVTPDTLEKYQRKPHPAVWVRVTGPMHVVHAAINRERSPAVVEVETAGRPIKCRYQWAAHRQPIPGEKGRAMEFLGRLSQEQDIDLVDCVRLDDPSDDDEDPLSGQQVTPAFQVTAGELWDASQGERATANPYYGNWLEITGTVRHLGRYSSGPYLSVGQDESRPIPCYFDEPEPWLMAKPWQSVRIVGLARHPTELRHCRLIEVTGEPVHFSPDELVKIFLDDKFDEAVPSHHAVVRGEITNVFPADEGDFYTLVTLKLNPEYDSFVFVCHFDKNERHTPTPQDVGKQISVFGECLGRTIQLLGRVVINQPIWIDPAEIAGPEHPKAQPDF